jgi:hypothetical protein
MNPLGTQLTNFSVFESELLTSLTDGHVIGFLLDSRIGDLKKSGLISHPKSVMPLHELLGKSATLFYPDPRRFEGREYSETVREFSHNLLGSEFVRFEVTTPALLLMTYQEGRFEKITVLSLDSLPMCLWHAEVYAFVDQYLGNDPLDKSQGQLWRSMIKLHAGTIGVESLKTCVGIFFSKLLPV